MAERTKKMVPPIRFKGFSDEWDERSIGEVLTEKIRPIELEDNTLYELVTVRRRNGGVVSRGFLYGKDILVKNYSQLRARDFIISKRQVVHGATGIVPQSLDKAIVSNEYMVAVGNDNISSEYLAIISTLPEMYRKFFLSSYGVDIEKLFFDAADWKKRNVVLPKLTEQNDICSYFSEIDRIIELYQRRHKKLVTLKEAMLKKMFPQNGAATPEIRFKGFSELWEEKKIGEICEIIGGGTPSTTVPEYWGGDINWFSPTEIGEKVYAEESVRKITILGLAKSAAKILPAGKTILFTSRASIGDMAILLVDGATNQGFQSFVLNDDIDAYFIYSAGYLMKHYAIKHASGSTFLEISSKQLKEMKIFMPSYQEQKRIGTYFRQMDELIGLHGSQVEKLNQIKSACLKQMFV